MRAAIDAQPSRCAVHRDEEEPDIGVHHDVAETLEHAVAVIVGESQFGRPRDAYEARHAAFKGAVGAAFGVRRRNKEVGRAFNEGFVVVCEFRPGQIFQPIGNTPAVETVLQLAVAVVI